MQESIAVTQNYVSRQNVANVYNFLQKKKNKDLFDSFSSVLTKYQPQLIEQIKKENEKKEKPRSLWNKITSKWGDGNEGNRAAFSLFD